MLALQQDFLIIRDINEVGNKGSLVRDRLRVHMLLFIYRVVNFILIIRKESRSYSRYLYYRCGHESVFFCYCLNLVLECLARQLFNSNPLSPFPSSPGNTPQFCKEGHIVSTPGPKMITQTFT